MLGSASASMQLQCERVLSKLCQCEKKQYARSKMSDLQAISLFIQLLYLRNPDIAVI